MNLRDGDARPERVDRAAGQEIAMALANANALEDRLDPLFLNSSLEHSGVYTFPYASIDEAVLFGVDHVPGFVFDPHGPAESFCGRFIGVDLDAERVVGVEELDEQGEPAFEERGPANQIRAPFLDELPERSALGRTGRDDGLVVFQVGNLPG